MFLLRRRIPFLAATLCVGTLTACSAIIGVKEIFLDQDGGSVDASSDATGEVITDASAPDTARDANIGTDGEAGAMDTGDPCALVDTQGDPKNCGTCHHDCFGGTCTAGICGAVQLTTTSHVGYVTVDGTNVYYTDDVPSAGVYKMPRLGAPGTQTLAAASPESDLWELAVDGTSIYWTARTASDGGPGSIYRASLDGGGVGVVAAGQVLADGLITDGTNLYWIEGTTGQIRNINRAGLTAGSGATTVGAGVGTGTPNTLAIRGGFLYATNDSANGTIDRCTLPNCSAKVTLLTVPSGGPSGIAIGTSRIFYTFAYEPGGSIHQMTLDGGSVADVALGQALPHTAATDDNFIYWLNGGPKTAGNLVDGQVMRCKLTNGVADCGTGATVLASKGKYVHGLVVDDKAIYWVSNSNVMRLAK